MMLKLASYIYIAKCAMHGYNINGIVIFEILETCCLYTSRYN